MSQPYFDLQQGAWLHYERNSPPTEPFHAGDGFDLYIDGCLNLPDAVTISRVGGGFDTRLVGTTPVSFNDA